MTENDEDNKNVDQFIINSNKNDLMKSPMLLSHQNIRSYLQILGFEFGIIGFFYFYSFLLKIPLGPNLQKNQRDLPPQNHTLFEILFYMNKLTQNITIWPIWGFFGLPSLFGLLICILLFVVFVRVIRKINCNNEIPSTTFIAVFGLCLIIATNFINGWQIGIFGAITQDINQGSELYNDAIRIKNIFTFIEDYEKIQSSLSVHARTHPPGAVIVIYLFYIIFRDPGLIAIAICTTATLTSVYFLNNMFKRLFDEELSNYLIFLFLVLPAIQIYYLANVYAIIVSLILGIIYFYFHPNNRLGIIGSIICLFLATFISFMSGFIILCLFLFEILYTHYSQLSTDKINKKLSLMQYFKNLQKLIIIVIFTIILYGILLFFFNFNYINSFLFAAESESGPGFMLLTNPLKYLITRLADILDILIFFGPILTFLCYRGFKCLKKEYSMNDETAIIYILSLSALISILIIFLTGAYDHGETARAAMYIYPFLLLPVAFYLKKKTFSHIERNKLLVIVFSQTLIMQLFGFYIW